VKGGQAKVEQGTNSVNVIELEHVRKQFGNFVAVQDANFGIRRGEFFSMLGPSGCGKTTLLKMIAGFEQPTRGKVLLEGADVSSVPPYKRNVNTVFQQYALFPHMTVVDNVAFGLESRGVKGDEARRRSMEMLQIVRLDQFAGRRPAQLSGGQQQRVALARALVNMPSALLLDEPLAALDLKLREAMQIELKRIQREVGITFIFVTHDQGEALTMSDRIAVMSEGRVEQIGTPEQIYHAPETVFVAGFIGSANLLPGVVEQAGRPAYVNLDIGQTIEVADSGDAQTGDPVTIMIRPERLWPKVAEPDGSSLAGTVSELIFQGASARLIIDLPGNDTEIVSTVEEDDHLPPVTAGQPIWMTWEDNTVPYLLRGRSGFSGATTTDVEHVEATLDGDTTAKADGHDGDGIGRRALLVGGGVAAAAAVIGGILWATGNDSGGTASTTTGGSTGTTGGSTVSTVAAGAPPAEIGGDLKILNWTLYIDPTEDGATGTVDRFKAATKIKLDYSENFNDNDEVFNRELQPYLGTGKRAAFDIVCPTYWMAARLRNLDWLEKLPREQIPNHANLEDRFLGLPWDKGADYFLPWQGGMTGLAYNEKLAGRKLTSVNDLFDPKFKGKVAFLSEMRDSIGLVMLAMGLDPTQDNPDDIDKALAKLNDATASGQIRAFTGNEYVQSLESGDLVACLAWSGDLVPLSATRPDLQFVFPDEGAMSWFDAMVIPKGAANVEQAAAWMNFVYDPVQAAQITQYMQYVTPVKGVKEELIKMGGDAAALAENQLIFPNEETAKRLFVFADLTQEREAELTDRFLKITGG